MIQSMVIIEMKKKTLMGLANSLNSILTKNSESKYFDLPFGVVRVEKSQLHLCSVNFYTNSIWWTLLGCFKSQMLFFIPEVVILKSLSAISKRWEQS